MNFSKIKRYKEFITESSEHNINKLVYYSFDIDDNLLYTATKIHMEHFVNGEWIEEKVDTEEFAKIRADKNWRYLTSHDGDGSFVEFRDWGPGGNDTFLNDFKYAVIHKRFAPSWNKFIECLVNGNVFSIITSRGHSPINIKRAIEWLIYEYGLDKFKNLPIKNVDKFESFEDQMIKNLLSYHELFGSNPEDIIDQYLNLCPIYPVSSPYFRSKFGKMSAEESKRVALNDFNDLVQSYAQELGVTAEYGFSDDDPKFVKSAIDQFTDLKDSNKNIKYTVFDTGGDRTIKKIDI